MAKTEFTVIGFRQKLFAESHNEINNKLEDQVISKVDHAKSLGLIIDNRLSWSNHVNELCKKVTSAIGALRRIRPLISQSTVALVYNTLIQPHNQRVTSKGSGNDKDLDKTRVKLFPNFTSIPFYYLLLSWVTNYVSNLGFLTCLSWIISIENSTLSNV